LPPEITIVSFAKSASLGKTGGGPGRFRKTTRRLCGIVPRDAPRPQIVQHPENQGRNPMSRLSELTVSDLNPEQQRALAKLRTVIAHDGLGGPFSVWLRMPGIGPAIIDLFVAQRQQGKLEKRLFELMTLVVIRHWSAQFAWWAHGPRAQQLGIAPEIVEAIRHGRTPVIAKADEKLVYELTDELMATQGLSEATCARAKALLGEPVLIELVFSIGFYNMVGTTLCSFDVPTPDGTKPLALS
jgi:4-carboxymuconolactone decarboxylase